MAEKQAESPKAQHDQGEKELHASSIPIIGDRSGRQITDNGAQGGPPSLNYNSKGRTSTAAFEVMVLIPAEMCGVVIGKGGWNIRRIRELARVRAFIEQDGEQPEEGRKKALHLQGHVDGVRLAVWMVNQCFGYYRSYRNQLSRPSSNLPSALAPADGSGARKGDTLPITEGEGVEVEVPGFAVGYIIGKRGENIRKLTAATGTRVQFNRNDSLMQSEVHRAYVEGSAVQTERCIQMMNDMVRKLFLLQQKRVSTQADYPAHQLVSPFGSVASSNLLVPGQQGNYGPQMDYTSEWIKYYQQIGNQRDADLLAERLKKM